MPEVIPPGMQIFIEMMNYWVIQRRFCSKNHAFGKCGSSLWIFA